MLCDVWQQPALQSHGVGSAPFSVPMACVSIHFQTSIDHASHLTIRCLQFPPHVSCSCIYFDCSMLMQQLSSSSSVCNLIISSMLSLSTLPSTSCRPAATVLSCHISASPSSFPPAQPLPPLLQNSTWGQGAGCGGDLQRRRMAAAALACIHAVQTLGDGAAGCNCSSLLSELLLLIQVSSSVQCIVLFRLMYRLSICFSVWIFIAIIELMLPAGSSLSSLLLFSSSLNYHHDRVVPQEVMPAASSKKLKLFTAAAAALLCSYSNLLILSHLIKCLQTHHAYVANMC
jgi:hypothetical protein